MKKEFNNYQLCYVENWEDIGTMTLMFSKEPVENLWGDDWNDKPYEHNAGLPYDETIDNIKNDYVTIIIDDSSSNYDNKLLTPCSGTPNSNFSIEDINIRQIIPWLRNKYLIIYAGETLEHTLLKLKTIDNIEIYYSGKLMEE